MTVKEARTGVSPEKEKENIDLVIAHWCLFAPGRSGMYETVKELILAEKQIPGVEAGLVNPDDEKGGKSDGWITTQSHGWAWENATIHVSHYFMTGYSTMQRPRVMMIHGTPEACYEAEKDSGSFTAVIGGLMNLDASIVMNRRQYYFWKAFDHHNTLHYVDKGIDLSRYTLKGMRIDCDGEPAIGMGEVERKGGVKLPFHVYWAINEYWKDNEKVRLHHWGTADERAILDVIFHKSGFDRWLGKYRLMGFQLFPENWYRGVDIVISPSLYGDPSRVHFESMACGTPVIDWGTSSSGDSCATMHAKPFDVQDLKECIAKLYDRIRANPQKVRNEVRQVAEQHYDIRRMATQVVKILREVQNK